MPITLKDVEYVAKLARLKLSEKEKKKFQKELDKIIRYIDQLNQVDTENVPPTSHVIPMQNVLREDEIKPSLTQKEALANAPDKKDGYFRVPRAFMNRE
ncbi:MAG: Asp-tRNA(Asn)/Glu-tRNA(Gln) amidotransferase subunit GatC [Candidatus Zixiibacteriota bacterium]